MSYTRTHIAVMATKIYCIILYYYILFTILLEALGLDPDLDLSDADRGRWQESKTKVCVWLLWQLWQLWLLWQLWQL